MQHPKLGQGFYVVVTAINTGNGAQGEETTVNPQYQHGMQPVVCKSRVVGSTVAIRTPSLCYM